MSELQAIESALSQAAGRRRLALALKGMWRGLLGGALAALIIAGVYRLLPLPAWSLLAVIILPVAGMLVGFIVGGWRRPRLAEMARWVDSRKHLKERLSTALEVSSRPEDNNAWQQLVVRDAAEHMRDLDSRQVVPIALSRTPKWALAVLVLVAGLGFVPEYRSADYLRKETDRENIKQVGKQLADLTRRNLEKRPPALEPTEKAMSSVVELGDKLAKLSLTRGEALKDIASVADRLKDEANNLSQDPALKRLEQMARASGSSSMENLAAMQKQMEALQKQLGSPTGHPEALEKLKQSLEKLNSAALDQAKDGGPTEQQRDQMSAALSALSRQMEDMGIQSPALEGAIEALAANNTELFLKDLKTSVRDLEKLRDLAKSLEQLQQQMEKVGKDLAEQLAKGQPEAAQQTLRKMAQQLQSANLSQEQLNKLLSEVAKAVAPGQNYGNVAQHLKNAGSQMQAGQKQNAAKELAKAADELEKLAEQMGDAQDLMAELEALKEASMLIASGQCWGLGKRPNAGQGGEPGAGVGTWADDDAMEWNGPITDTWDNSGIVREDMDARGVSDRDANPNDALKPTRVRGQFSPGTQMPSITLKGVSIKGQSSVQYEAAAAAAQSDAESALSQQKVPRAYQGAVKDYFDDLK